MDTISKKLPFQIKGPPSEACNKKDSTEAKVKHAIAENFYYLEYSLCFSKNKRISISIIEEEGIYFLFNWESELVLRLKDGKQKNISRLQSAIMLDNTVSGMHLKLQKDVEYKFCVIAFVQPKVPQKKLLNTSYYKFKQRFCQEIKCTTFLFCGKPNLKLIEKINQLSETTKDNIASELIMQGLVYEILGLKMEQMLKEVNGIEQNNGGLSLRDMEEVNVISNFIRENPSVDYTIEFLCAQTGLSPAKLQEGFKHMHNCTAINFIRRVRLEKSAELIKTTDMNISEIVYSLGLTSRSYFSKIFKKKYNCSPKHFQAQNRKLEERV